MSRRARRYMTAIGTHIVNIYLRFVARESRDFNRFSIRSLHDGPSINAKSASLFYSFVRVHLDEEHSRSLPFCIKSTRLAAPYRASTLRHKQIPNSSAGNELVRRITLG